MPPAGKKSSSSRDGEGDVDMEQGRSGHSNVEDLRQMLGTLNRREETKASPAGAGADSASAGGRWQLIEGWTACPIGVMPGKEDQDLFVPLVHAAGRRIGGGGAGAHSCGRQSLVW
eukprot:GABV01009278.1.p2 GENE.GABV01009278.1~~GABV01009278.1.p2  ORF type:complete len:116 (-),score=21.42 GABV01009278.1:110-457(-)